MPDGSFLNLTTTGLSQTYPATDFDPRRLTAFTQKSAERIHDLCVASEQHIYTLSNQTLQVGSIPNEGHISWRKLLELPNSNFKKRTFGDRANSNGHIYLSIGATLYRYSPKSNELIKLREFSEEITHIILDTNDNLIIGTRSEIARFHPEITHLVQLNRDYDIWCFDLAINHQNQEIWAATDLGIVKIDLNNNDLVHFPEAMSPAESLAISEEGRIWVTARDGLRLFDKNSGTYVRYPRQNEIRSELASRQIEYLKVRRRHDGILFLQALTHLDLIREDTVLTHPPGGGKIFLSHYTVLERKKDGVTQKVDRVFWDSPDISLSSDLLSIELQFATTDLRSHSDNSFEYRIGKDQWISAPNGKVTLSGLSPGNFLIEVRAFDSGGRLLEETFDTRLQIKAPFWFHPSFITACIVGIFGLGYALQSSRTRLIEKSRVQIQKSEERYRRIFERSSDAIILVGRDLLIHRANPAAHRLLNISNQIHEPASFLAIDPSRLESLVKKALDGKRVINEEVEFHGRSNSVLQTQISISETSGDDEVRIHLRDITKETELESQVRHAQKMEAVGTLAGGIAHDFNNLLAPIILHSEMATEDLKARTPGSIESTIESLDICRDAARKAADLVRELMRFARGSDDGHQCVDLVRACADSERLLRGSITSNVGLTLELTDEEVPVRCSLYHFELALTNLCVNASHAIGDGTGEITVRVARKNLGDGDRAVVSISDNGCGMDEETCQRIFEPFFTTKDVGKGTGLGLTMVHRFVSDSGGEISLDSKVNKGTTFSLMFPLEHLSEGETLLAKAPTLRRATPVTPIKLKTRSSSVLKARAKTPPQKRLLIIDDEPLVLKATSMILQRHGFEVDSYLQATKALEKFREAPSGYDFIITDQMMPDITGIELAREVKIISPNTPIILLTGYSKVALDSEECAELFTAIHTKPLDYAELNRSIKENLAPTSSVALIS
ncbi:MAG: ATP-binding protein, partial [Verrucomicrobiota bacterium]